MSDEQRRPLLVYIQGILPSLNPTERLIAEYVLHDPERILSSSIAEMRDGSGASVGSIVGFCRRLGLKGFAEFKIALARELAQSGFSGFAPGSDAAPSQNGTVFDKVFQFHAQSLVDTLQINSQETMRQAARALERARRIELFAIGISYPIAYLASCKLRLIGLPASAQFDSHMQLIAATQLGKGSRVRDLLLRSDQRDGAVPRGCSSQGGPYHLPDQLCQIADHPGGRSGALRDTQRDQIFSGPARLPNHSTGHRGRTFRIARLRRTRIGPRCSYATPARNC